MAQREGSVYLYLFIVACVLFIVMTALFFANNADKQTIMAAKDVLQRQTAEARTQLKTKDEEIQRYRELIAGSVGQDWASFSEFKSHVETDELKGKAQRVVNEILKAQGESERNYDRLIQPYEDVVTLLPKLKAARDEAIEKRTAAEKSLADAQEAAKKSEDKLRQEKQDVQQKLSEAESKFEDCDNKARTREAELQSQVDGERLKGVDTALTLNRQINKLNNQIRSLQSKVEELQKESRKEKNFDDVLPDGKIQYVLASSGKAWIDLGRVNHIQNGLVFRVFQTVKGGKKVFKGRLEIQKVDETMSEARVVEETDPMNPIVAGDFVSSPFYDSKESPVFVFAGAEMESKDVTKDFVVAKMKQYGAQVQNKVDINTDYLVALKNFESTPEYRTAREFGVTVIRERDLLSFIGQ